MMIIVEVNDELPMEQQYIVELYYLDEFVVDVH
jgi:hypothetical protein